MDWIEAHLLKLPDELQNWCEKIECLYSTQLSEWEIIRNRYLQIDRVERRTLFFDKFRIDIQYNPARVRSTCADLSKTAIDARPCFLCAQNLPEEQKGFLILNKYLLLINPFPVFERHLTISDVTHVPQKITGRIPDMLSLAKELNGYTVFYNGSCCGASAPDHFHFQATKWGKMPVDTEIPFIKKKLGKPIFHSKDIQITEIKNYLRSTIIIESASWKLIDNFFNKIYHQLPCDKKSGEPMMNILTNFENGQYCLTIFPRRAQRPSCYFKKGNEQILVSPASVEMGGLIIIPRKEDFQKITTNDVTAIFEEVSFPSFPGQLLGHI